ncbi:hypothetical protein diail_2928 [Diaporthe ilicicola]|nr:hypothetical protein diail_2928 [Diaporthe ilicicola]
MPVELRPRRSKATAPAESAAVEETPKPKVAKTPKSTKRKATEDDSPAVTKKQKSVKTPAKSKDVADTAAEAEVSTPAPKAKKAKAPAKKKDTDDAAPEAAEKPTPKPKKEKTPAKPNETLQPTVAETPKPASKATPKSTAKETTTSAVKETPKPAGKVTPKSAPKSSVKETPKPAGKAAPKSAAKYTPKPVAEETDETPAPKSKAKQEKTPKKTPAKATPAKATPAKATPAKATPAKSAQKSGKQAEPEQTVEDQDNTVQEADNDATVAAEEKAFSDEEVDEQTKALVMTVDSGDEDEQASGVITFEQGQDVGIIPDVSKELSKKEKKKEKKALKASSSQTKEETGVIYIGRLPHGFYEHEMKNYFSQFGPIRNLRVSRNKKTGKAKHFAFVEFEEASTAEIVAKTMDNYLLFGHILKCSVIPKAQVHKDLFKGSNKRFKSIPWNKMQGKEMERPKLEKQWERSINLENKKRAARAKRLEALGYEFNAPELKSVTEAKAIADREEAPKAIEAPPPAAEAQTETTPAQNVEESTVEEQKEDVEATPAKKATRGRGRPAKTPQKVAAAAETPRKTRRTKA